MHKFEVGDLLKIRDASPVSMKYRKLTIVIIALENEQKYSVMWSDGVFSDRCHLEDGSFYCYSSLRNEEI